MRAFIARLFIGLLILIITLPVPALATNTNQLEKYLTVEAAILGASDNISVDYQKPDGSSEITIKPTRSWIPASTIKAFVLIEVFNQIRQGLISLDQRVTIKAQNVVSTSLETDEFPRLIEGTQATVKQLSEAMIIQSDNTAYNTLLDVLDRQNINNTLSSLGLTETVVGEKLNLDDDQYQADSQVPGHQFNTTTVKDYASLFSMLTNNKIPGSEQMIAIFKRQKFNDMIPALIPKSVEVAHKTGFWAPIFHDGGVVYKPNDPFILAIFSNANDPTVNARLAKVAYYQNADSVGLSMNPGPNQTSNDQISSSDSYPTITLAKIPSNADLKILGAETNAKFPEVTAADLGITTTDLTSGLDDSKNIKPAIIFPGSWIYLVKRAIEAIQLTSAQNNDEKANIMVNLAHARLSEIKAMQNSNRPDLIALLSTDEQSTLAKAVTLAKNNTNHEQQLSQVKQLSDMSFAVVGNSLDRAKGTEKEKLIDNIYSGFKKNQSEVAPVLQKSLPTSPFNQPLVGTVQEINKDKMIVVFSDGSTKTVLLNKNTPSRTFGQMTIDQKTTQASVGAKIAIVGELTQAGEIIPNFILKNVPKEIPEKKEGIVIKIDSHNKSLEVRQFNGENVTVLIDPSTIVKGRNTNVSINGIKAGSTITFFGNSLISTQSSSTKPPTSSPSALSPKTKSSKNPPNPDKPTDPQKVPTTTDSRTKQESSSLPSTQQQTTVKATTITIVKNSSGKNERVESPKNSDTKQTDNGKQSAPDSNSPKQSKH